MAIELLEKTHRVIVIQESLFRRVSQAQGLYTINTVVDINNLV